jgi:hypothetical protein
MCFTNLTESIIASIERLTPREKQEIRDYLRLEAFRDAARKEFCKLQYNLTAKPN